MTCSNKLIVHSKGVLSHAPIVNESLLAKAGQFPSAILSSLDMGAVSFSSSPSEGGLLLAKRLRISDPLLKGKGMGSFCMVLVDGTFVECSNEEDLPLSTDSFTYSSGLNNLAFSRLDPFLVFDTWESHFDGVIQCILPKPISDHSPILLDGVAVRNRPIPFRFENMQLKDAKEREGFLTTEEADAKRQALGDYGKWALFKEISCRQKSRIKIDREFFEDIGLKEGIVRAYSSILFEPPYWRPSINTLDFKVLDVAEVVGLEELFTDEEVFNALVDLNGDKALGSNGFYLAFWLFSWDFVKDEGGTKDLKDFKPISLVSSMYKLLAKVLASRLKLVLGKLDIKKAYDHVNWNFLSFVLEKMNFGQSALRFKAREFFISLFICCSNGGSKLFSSKSYGRWLYFKGKENLEKSKLTPIGSVDQVEELISVRGCKVSTLPSTYLRLPLGAPFRSLVVWDWVEERVGEEDTSCEAIYYVFGREQGRKDVPFGHKLSGANLERKNVGGGLVKLEMGV
ncbi:hypothetical protein CK203_047808 [Vitis vinifera]|uniref:Reverse transcriptase domain-containing protein n=1 Tax=Vitis vinifera TaxID=29760 RepID=A0A438H8K0_VITVI|nr:hypothetical protein CK203_047808 [Vitis vinifera]